VKIEKLSKLVADVQHVEHQFSLQGMADRTYNPWMPYQPADFIGIIWECLPELTGKHFLDIGCGPGTKMQIAQDLFGFEVHGIEVDPAMAEEARKRFSGAGTVVTGDALDLQPAYHPLDVFDLIWLYRPFRDPAAEYKLEQQIIEAMKPGAILAGGMWDTDVSCLGWQVIVDDCIISPDGATQIVRGAWQKPAPVE
jgi:SAM-dependent methyltransferase